MNTLLNNVLKKIIVASWGEPDYTAGVSISSYTTAANQFAAPCDGIILFTIKQNGSAFLNNSTAAVNSSQYWTDGSRWLAISKGETFYCTNHLAATGLMDCFYPLKGAI